jgi:hypothetical protein
MAKSKSSKKKSSVKVNDLQATKNPKGGATGSFDTKVSLKFVPTK